jgi:negative regulator of replication initiation
MYSLEFCDNPENGELFDGHVSYDDSLSDDYIEHLKALDRFMYLADMFRIVRSCSFDLQELHGGDDIEFWMINKTLINYLNAVKLLEIGQEETDTGSLRKRDMRRN